MENVWQCMRDNWLSNRVFRSYDAILDHCCDARDRLVGQRRGVILPQRPERSPRAVITGKVSLAWLA
jgi:hypothetical protein